MRKTLFGATTIAGVLLALLAGPSGYAGPGKGKGKGADDDNSPGEKVLKASLSGYSEVPSISTTGKGEFRATINQPGTEIKFELEYSDLKGTASVAHVHLGQRGVSGSPVFWLCGGGGMAACPVTATGTNKVTGTITALNILDVPAQGITGASADKLKAVIDAMRSGATYANVHSSLFPSGEIRGQIKSRGKGHED